MPVEREGQTNPLLDSAEAIGLAPDEREQKEQVPIDPKPGSFETFMATFANPARWAGR